MVESHLRKENLAGLNFAEYNPVAETCRNTMGRIGGGVLILVHRAVKADRFDLEVPKTEAIEICTIKLYPLYDAGSALLVSGVYCPPKLTSQIDLGCLCEYSRMIVDDATQVELSHIMTGDYNTTSWLDTFNEWCLEEGGWLLSNPSVPTRSTGTVIDRAILFPGHYIPSTFIQRDAEEEVDPDPLGSSYYPAHVAPEMAVADHYPLVIPIPCDVQQEHFHTRKLDIGALSDEDWEACDTETASLLIQHGEFLREAWESDNLDRYCVKIEQILRETFEKEWRTVKEVQHVDPIKRFLKLYSEHRLLNELKLAISSGETGKMELLMDKITADGWHDFLKTVSRSNTKAMYAYLAKAEGRKQWAHIAVKNAPLVYYDKVLQTDREKAEKLAQIFSIRMAARTADDTEEEGDALTWCAPLTSFNERIDQSHEPVGSIEIQKALKGLKPGKAPGPDNLPSAVYRRIPSLATHLERIFNMMYKTGRIPVTWRRVHLVPIPKAGKDMRQATSYRPITLICTAMKIFETVLYHRLLPLIEPKLHPAQYAYRRLRGTEMCLVELMDAVHRGLHRNRWCYVVSFDIAGAFDNVPHQRLMQGLEMMGVDKHTRRLIHNWLRDRTFQVKLTTPNGNCMSTIHPISKGLPQGGVLSPLLWLAFFNPLLTRLDELRKEDPIEGVEYVDFVYADDITTIITAPDEALLQEASMRNKEHIQKILSKELSLLLELGKCKNIVMNPDLLPNGVYRRAPNTVATTTRNRIAQQRKAEGRYVVARLDFEVGGGADQMNAQVIQRDTGYPFPLSTEMEILGITIDPWFTLDAHYQKMVAKAPVRQGILNRLAKARWGLEVGVQKMARDSVIGSILRYGLVLTGSCFPPDLMRKMNTQILNISARKVGGIARTARIESLHFVTEVMSFYNMYAVHCADFLDSCLRAHHSTVQERMRGEISGYFKHNPLETCDINIAIPFARILERCPDGRIPAIWHNARWFCNTYRDKPQAAIIADVTGTFVCNAEEIEKSLLYKQLMYGFKETHGWLDVALQILKPLEWSPEASPQNYHNIDEALPQKFTWPCFYPGGIPPLEGLELIGNDDTYDRGQNVSVHVGVMVLDRTGMTVCVVYSRGRIVHRNLYVHGKVISQDTPEYLQEAAVIHAIRVLRDWIQEYPAGLYNTSHIMIYAGTHGLIAAIRRWLITGVLEMHSAAASLFLDEIASLDKWIRRPMGLMPLEFFESAEEWRKMPWINQELLRIAEEFRSLTQPGLGATWRRSLPAIPLSKLEIKALLKTQYETDELKALDLLKELGSDSAGVITGLQLTREIVSIAIAELKHDHRAQINLLRILSGVRFKYAAYGTLVPIQCPNSFYGRQCRKEDSYEHMLACYGLDALAQKGPLAIPFLTKMAKRTKPGPYYKSQPMFI